MPPYLRLVYSKNWKNGTPPRSATSVPLQRSLLELPNAPNSAAGNKANALTIVRPAAAKVIEALIDDLLAEVR